MYFIVQGTLSYGEEYCEERCDNSLPYEACSSNRGCGCLPLSHNNKSSICAFVYATCSKLSSCAADNKTCYQPHYICVKHSRCHTSPLCYPMHMTTQSICPTISTTSINIKFKTRSFCFCFIAVSPIPDDGICENATWNTNGITMAGGNGSGSELNQLQFPSGIFLDDDSNLYVADGFNHRVVKWNYGSSVGQLVAGGNGEGNRTDQLRYPKNLIVGKNGTMFICDGNNRILKWEKNAREGEQIIANASCYGIHADRRGSLYYSQAGYHQIIRWPENEIVAGGNGEGSHLNQLLFPYDFFIKNDKSIFIADGGNHRILEWIIGDKQGSVRAGGYGPGHNLSQFYQPMSVVVDQSDALYIADYDNDRIMRWLKNSKSGIVIVGERGEGKEKDQLDRPIQLLFDKQGNLWVTDEMNHRIQMFKIDKSSCKT
ncbi:unnamed protein product [Rotaria sp. Silwood2]|nr:unnamed protein product [Rotaria sp. Silwood2]CAF2998194.1 unnamed protein product [Rotaria sp. Silwood2]